MADMTHDEAVQYMRENGRKLSMYYGALDNATTAARLIVEHVESLQSQLAAAKEQVAAYWLQITELVDERELLVTRKNTLGQMLAASDEQLAAEREHNRKVIAQLEDYAFRLEQEKAAERERADGLQRVVDAARGLIAGDLEALGIQDSAVHAILTRLNYAAPVPAQPVAVPEGGA